MFDPCVEFGKLDDPHQLEYLNEKPCSLQKYLKHLLPPDESIKIEEGPELLNCMGIPAINKSHCFLKNEGSYTCSMCKEIFCRYCCYNPVKDRDPCRKANKFSKSYYDNKNESLCVECYKKELFLPIGDKSIIMSNSEMIGVLRKNNYQIGDEADPHLVQEMYDMHLLGDKRHHELSDDIEFPKYSSKALE